MNDNAIQLKNPGIIYKKSSSASVYPVLKRFCEVIDNRFYIDTYLAKIGELKIYVAKGFNGMTICGTCGFQNNSFAQVCKCGVDLKDNRFLIFEGDDSNTRGYGKMASVPISQKSILKIYDRFFYRNRYYILVQFLDFKLLSDMPSPVSPVQILDLGIDIGAALSYLHSQEIFGVRLSPADILISDGKPLLANFSPCFKYDNVINDSQKLKKMVRNDIKELGKLLLSLCFTHIHDFKSANIKSGVLGRFLDVINYYIEISGSDLLNFVNALSIIRSDFFQNPKNENINIESQNEKKKFKNPPIGMCCRIPLYKTKLQS